jgi:hypothetical protein
MKRIVQISPKATKISPKTTTPPTRGKMKINLNRNLSYDLIGQDSRTGITVLVKFTDVFGLSKQIEIAPNNFKKF